MCDDKLSTHYVCVSIMCRVCVECVSSVRCMFVVCFWSDERQLESEIFKKVNERKKEKH